MKNQEINIEVAKIHKAHGLKGEMKISWVHPFEDINHLFDYLLIDTKGHLIPYFIERIRSDMQLVKLEQVDRLEDTSDLVNRKAFVPINCIPKEYMSPEPISENPDDALIGFTIKDAQGEEIGMIQQIVEMPQQSLAEIEYMQKSVLIPLNEHFIVDKNEEHKLLVMDLPEGILDL